MHRRSLWLRLRALVAPARAERDLHDELQFHIEMQARKHVAAGVDADEAVRRARLEFGNVELAKEDARDVRGIRPLEEVLQDVRYAVRGLRRTPAFTLSVILTIALGLGISTSAFAIFNAYVLKPFDVRDPYSLYAVQWADRTGRVRDMSAAAVEALHRPRSAFSDVAVYRTFSARLKGLAAIGDGVSENYFDMLGVRTSIGRTLVADDRATAVIVLSHSAWRTRFGGDSDVVGRLTLVRGYPFKIIGVAREGFGGLFKKPRDFWVPIGSLARFDSTRAPGRPPNEEVSTIARLAPGAFEEQGRAFVALQLSGLTATMPDSARFARAFLTSRASAIPRSVTSYLTFAPLVIAFGLVLVLACANVANMLLARGLARQRELGVRLALGAARARLVRQLVTESVVLALPSVAIGLGIAWLAVGIGVRALFATLPADLAAFVRLVPLEPDLRVALFAFVAAMASAFVFGLLPSLQTTRLSVVQATRGMFVLESSPGRMRNALIVGQILVSTLLLAVAAILLREGARLGRMDTGLRTRDVISIEVDDKSRAAVLATLRADRVVDTIAAAASLPLDMRFPTASVAASGDSIVVEASYNRVSRSYFEVLGIALTTGRSFTAQDESNAAGSVVIVSEAAARRLWPAGSPLGRTLRVRLRADGRSDPLSRYQDARVVGTVRNVVVNSVEMGKEQPIMYFPAAPEESGCCILARVKGEPTLAKRSLDAALDKAAPGGVDRIDRLETFVVGAVYPYRVAYWLALSLGLIALGLTAVGVYGVVSYVASQRAREIGIRIALGATTRDVLELVLRQTVRHAVVGIAAGLLLAIGTARIIASNVPGMPVFDAPAFLGAGVCVFIACMTSALLPSRRAIGTDPSEVLRYE